MLKETQFKYGKTMELLPKDGEYSILTRDQRLRLRDLMKNSVSTSTDHSISYQNFHSTELLRCLAEPTWSSRDGERTKDNNSSGSMKNLRPSEITTGRTIALTSKVTVAATTSEPSQVSTQDGGRCSDTRTTT
jgi:hypothetical protein